MFEDYINQKQSLYCSLLSFIDNPDDSTGEYYKLIIIIQDHQICQDRSEMKIFISLLKSIFNNHHRLEGFIKKIEQILLYLSNVIRNFYSDYEIYDLFEDNKLILSFLIQNKILFIDQYLFNILHSKGDGYSDYFDNQTPEYNEKRNMGENDSYICRLIRNDTVEEFIKHVYRNTVPLSSTITPSIFETNLFLIGKNPSLIEYAAFYGSIQIFQFLIFNQVKLKESLWLYVIHSNKAELIHLLEDYKVEPPNGSYEDCLKEAIKCHHNDIANYIQDSLLNKRIDDFDPKENKDENPIDLCFNCYNFELIPKYFNDINDLIYYSIKYDYREVVEFFINNGILNLNQTEKISNCFFFIISPLCIWLLTIIV